MKFTDLNLQIMLHKIKSPFFINSAWNFLGMLLPMVAAFFMIPIVIHHIGLPKFGVFSLMIMLIGAMTLFDFGLTRSITHSASKYYHENNPTDFLSAIKCGWVILSFIVVLLSVLLFLFSGYVAAFILKTDNSPLYSEVVNCIKITAIALPFVMSQAICSSVMEALSAFKKINLFRTPFWVLMYAIPLIFSLFTSNIFYLTASVFSLRILMAIVFYFLMTVEIRKFTKRKLLIAPVSKKIVLEIVTYGGWISLGNVIVPVMLYLDRFIVASVVGPDIFPYYGTPYEVISRITVITAAVCGVLFPLLAGTMRNNIIEADSYFKKSIFLIFVTTFPCAVIGIVFSKLFLSLWINPDFASQAWPVFSLLLLGFLIYGLFQPAFIWIMASGKPWIVTVVQVFDLLTYIVYLPWLAKHYGIIGAAIGWDLRMVCGFFLIFFIRYLLYRRHLASHRVV